MDVTGFLWRTLFFSKDSVFEWGYVDFTLRLSATNVSKTALLSSKQRLCMVILNVSSTVFCNRCPPLIQMILPLLILFVSLLQQHGSETESSHVSKFQQPSLKEHNGKLRVFNVCLAVTFNRGWVGNKGQFSHIHSCSYINFQNSNLHLLQSTSCLSLNSNEWIRFIQFKQHYPG